MIDKSQMLMMYYNVLLLRLQWQIRMAKSWCWWRDRCHHNCQKPNVDDVLQVAVADEDGKGVVDYEAFATLLTSHRKWFFVNTYVNVLSNAVKAILFHSVCDCGRPFQFRIESDFWWFCIKVCWLVAYKACHYSLHTVKIDLLTSKPFNEFQGQNKLFQFLI